jgi:hypothetical protein
MFHFLLSYLGTATALRYNRFSSLCLGYKWRQGIRQTQEIRAAILLSLSKVLKPSVLPLAWRRIAA